MEVMDGGREGCLDGRKKRQPALQSLLGFGLHPWQLPLPPAGQACLTSDLSRLLFLHLCLNLDWLL